MVGLNSDKDYRLPFPRVLRIEPASLCNLSCIHCPTGMFSMERGVMTWEMFTSILLNIKCNKEAIKVIVLYHGGEPFLNRKLPDMVKRIREIDGYESILVKTVSNGMLLNDSLSKNLILSGLDVIEVSIDGINAKENNIIRRGCSYTKVVSNIRGLIDKKIEMCSQRPQIFISNVQFLNHGSYNLESLQAKIPGYLLREFSGKYEDGIGGINPVLGMVWPNMGDISEKFDVFIDPSDKEIRNYCDHVYNTMTVRWNGDVVPCCYDLTSKNVMGNVIHSELFSIWNNERYIDLRRSIAEKRFCHLCVNCNKVKPSAYLVVKKSEQK